MPRPLVRTRRQARQLLTVALHALRDVAKAAPTKDRQERFLLPNGVVRNTALAHSHVRAALQALNHRNHS